MPVEFLHDKQAARYGRYHANPIPKQLARLFYLSPQDKQTATSLERSFKKHDKPGYKNWHQIPGGPHR